MKTLIRILILFGLAALLSGTTYYMSHYVHPMPPRGKIPSVCLFWASAFRLSVPISLVLFFFGLSKAFTRWYPFATVLGTVVGVNFVIRFLVEFLPEFVSRKWFMVTIPLGLLFIAVSLLLTLKESPVVLTFLRLICATLTAILITIFFPFILLGFGWYLKKKNRNIKFRELWKQSPAIYQFIIVNIYPIFFAVLPAIRLMKSKAKAERRLLRKQYRKTAPPAYHSKLDLSRMKIGDVILTGKESWGYSIPIQASNLLSNGEENRFWTHAAIYSGEGKVVEAQVLKGVTETGIADFFFKHGYKLKVLRTKYLQAETLQKVVEYCRSKSHLNSSYDFWGATFYSLSALIPSMLSGWLESDFAKRVFNVQDAYFCSELVAESFLVNGLNAFYRQPWRVKPLDFAFNPLFEEVDCGFEFVPGAESAT